LHNEHAKAVSIIRRTLRKKETSFYSIESSVDLPDISDQVYTLSGIMNVPGGDSQRNGQFTVCTAHKMDFISIEGPFPGLSSCHFCIFERCIKSG
jgi:hypothetical protein